ncbi:MAG: carboxylesterase/lipase family protein [Deltaproteobacteria bacterium]
MTFSYSRLFAPIFILLLPTFVGCGQQRLNLTPGEYSEEIRFPDIYEDISVFEKPECTTSSVKVGQGLLCGNQIGASGGKGAAAYLGIPYAESTGGGNRWRAPVPKAGWSGVLRATRLGPSCPQNADLDYPQSEDCLSLNVWTPLNGADTPRAVMVFIYGGAFVFGSNCDPTYDGAYTAAYGDVVVVSMNYRLGALGFLAGVEDKRTGEKINGNFGLQDQILALKWVRENIEAFGGDPEKITVYGESAGAMSIGIHLVRPETSKLFRAAIMGSNPYGVPYKSLKNAESITKRFAHNLGCPKDDIECMRGKLPAVVLYAQQQRNLIWPSVFNGLRDLLAWSPVIDRDFLKGQPLEMLTEGATDKPIIVGTNRNEGLLFVEKTKSTLQVGEISDFEYRLAIDFIFRDNEIREKIYENYPPNKDRNAEIISKIITEYLFTCPNHYAASDGSSRAWYYLFDHVSSFNFWPSVPACKDAVCHSDELPYVFHTAAERGDSFTPQEKLLSNLMVGYWTDFAKYLRPDRSGSEWPPYMPGSMKLVFVTPVAQIKADDEKNADCEFWDKIGYDLTGSFWGLF